MSVVASVTVPLAQSSGHDLGGNRSPSPQDAKGKEAMGIDGNDLGQPPRLESLLRQRL